MTIYLGADALHAENLKEKYVLRNGSSYIKLNLYTNILLVDAKTSRGFLLISFCRILICVLNLTESNIFIQAALEALLIIKKFLKGLRNTTTSKISFAKTMV
jgi:hypothetical protein